MGRLTSLVKRSSGQKPVGARRPRKRQPSQLAFTANHRASTASSILQSLLTLYGLVTLMHGVVIPISDALAKPVEHAAYRQMFYIFMHGVGIVCIVYLNWLISIHQRRAKKRATRSAAASASVAHTTDGVSFSDDQSYRRPATIDIPLARRGPPPSTVADPPLDDAETVPQHVAAGEVPLASAEEDTDADENKAAVGATDGERMTPVAVLDSDRSLLGANGVESQRGGLYKPRRRQLKRNPLVTDLPPLQAAGRPGGLAEGAAPAANHLQSPVSDVPDTPESPFTPGAFTVSPITQSESGINLYLRLGAIVFGFGVMIHDGFKISEVIERNGVSTCHDIWFIPKQVIHLVFIMAQTYYLFKHHRITFNTQLPLIRFMMVHLMVTNLCIWVKTVIYEIKIGLSADYHSSREASKVFPGNETRESGIYAPASRNYSAFGETSSNATGCLDQLLEDGPSHMLGPYLYPCAVEYGLICAAICFKVFSKIGDTKVTPYGRKMYPEGPRFTACHKSHKGLFLGLLIMICVLVPMISLQLLNSVDKSHQSLYMLVVLIVECAVLLFTTGMSLLGTAKTIRHLRLYRVRGNEAFDVNLLFVGLAGILCYNLFVSVSVGSCALDSNDSGHCPRWTGHRNFITKAAGLKAMLEVVQSIFQTLFIMQGIQRRITLELVTQNHKPGRGIAIGLLIANLAMWIEAVFEAKSSIAEDFPQEYFGTMAWSIVKYIFLPLIIFYRFHSSVCLSEIWIHSYKMPKKKRAMD